ncbi:MAG: PD40 domain-containing protein [Anaerolinea sp.]|nr:PD40 domain-containing protein [Anaerolinea sp.]
MIWRLFALTVIMSLLVSAAVQVGQSQPRTEVAYMAYTLDGADIHLTDTRLGLTRNLTDHPAHDAAPAWSPDGSLLAFMSDRDGRPNIYLMDRSGRDVRRLTSGDETYTNPLWSADGTQIAFFVPSRGQGIIYSVNVDGSDMHQIAGGDLPPIGIVMDLAVEPGSISRSFSPDGSQIAFMAHRGGSWGIWISDNRRRDERLLISIGREYTDTPVWSPDGAELAFVSYRDGMSDLYVVDVEGANRVRRMTFNRAVEAVPVWSPP